MTWLVLPVKSITQGKSRLAPYLTAAARRELNMELLARSLILAARYPGLDRTIVVSRCPEVLGQAKAARAGWLTEKREGLNEAVAQAVAGLTELAGEQILVVSCDLPFAREDDLRALVRPGQATLATDRAGSGTNALCLPAGTAFHFQYGPSSRHRHIEEANRRGLTCRVLHRPSLAFDLDSVADYREWECQEGERAA